MTVKEQQKLMIPAQTSDKDDYIQGIGKKEVMMIGIALMVAIFLILYGVITNRNLPVWVFSAFFLVAVTVIVVRRDSINESVIDKVRLMVTYQKSQKCYQYQQYDFYELKEDGIYDGE